MMTGVIDLLTVYSALSHPLTHSSGIGVGISGFSDIIGDL